jgi:response regulator RpfG family c-di-GMP phosphodiesterase
MTAKILFVDDEANILSAFKRQLRNRYEIDTATSGRDALYLIQDEPYAVIVSDLRMPVMDGVQFLTQAKGILPDSVRILLTGHADLATAIDAINQGDIFRFLTKPCAPEVLMTSLDAALKQYSLIIAEREILEKTLNKTVMLMTDMLGLANPVAYGLAIRLRRIVGVITNSMQLPNAWQFELAAMLSQIGCVALPTVLLNKVYSGEPLQENEVSMYASHPMIGFRLLENIPRLESIAQMVRDQHRNCSSYADQPYSHITQDIELGSKILRVASDYDHFIQTGLSHAEIIQQMLHKSAIYDSDIVEALGNQEISQDAWKTILVDVRSAKQGMIANEDIYSKDGTLLLRKGTEISLATLETLKLTAKNLGVVEPFRVLVQS